MTTNDDTTLVSLKSSIGKLMAIVSLLEKPSTRLKVLQTVFLMMTAMSPKIPIEERKELSRRIMAQRLVVITCNQLLGVLGRTDHLDASQNLNVNLFSLEEELWRISVDYNLIIPDVRFLDALTTITTMIDQQGERDIKVESHAEEAFAKMGSGKFSLKDLD